MRRCYLKLECRRVEERGLMRRRFEGDNGQVTLGQ